MVLASTWIGSLQFLSAVTPSAVSAGMTKIATTIAAKIAGRGDTTGLVRKYLFTLETTV
jgi:hypothetical protein